jgi:hypothetical protein
MFGSRYHTLDQALAAGEIDQLKYARRLLVELVNRAAVLSALVDDSESGSLQALNDFVLPAIEIFRSDVKEIIARAARAGLVRTVDDLTAMEGQAYAPEVRNFGGPLVHLEPGPGRPDDSCV